jgi:hypothetical protein
MCRLGACRPLAGTHPEEFTIVIHPAFRAGFVALMLTVAATAQAAPRGAADRAPEVMRDGDMTTLPTGTPPAWMTDALLGALQPHAGATTTSIAPAIPMRADGVQNSKPHQNPAFPAAFVFQSNSALFLAADVAASRRGPIAG